MGKNPADPGPSGLRYILYLLGRGMVLVVLVAVAVGVVACCALAL